MEPLTGERGQTLLVVAIALAVAAVTVIALREAQDRFASAARIDRAGEAAVEAAAQSVADAYIAHLTSIRARARETPAPTQNVPGVIADPRTVEAARVAAEELARANGAAGVEELALSCSRGQVEARLRLGDRSHHAGFAAPECSQR